MTRAAHPAPPTAAEAHPFAYHATQRFLWAFEGLILGALLFALGAVLFVAVLGTALGSATLGADPVVLAFLALSAASPLLFSRAEARWFGAANPWTIFAVCALFALPVLAAVYMFLFANVTFLKAYGPALRVFGYASAFQGAVYGFLSGLVYRPAAVEGEEPVHVKAPLRKKLRLRRKTLRPKAKAKPRAKSAPASRPHRAAPHDPKAPRRVPVRRRRRPGPSR